jgi:endonuclease/exonuclease/phosphatase family metal-dependent hydrolase
MRSRRFWILASVSIFFIGFIVFCFRTHRFIRYQEPTFLTFRELQKLYKNPHPGGLLGWKLSRFRRTPIISNEAYYQGVRPSYHTNPKLGPYLTLASWNIGEEELFHLKDTIAVFSSFDQFRSLVNSGKAPEGSHEYKEVLQQRERLANADIIVLQEVTIGNKRSEYRDEARALGEALKMNYAYGAEQFELDPVVLGLEKIYYPDGKTVDQARTNDYAADPARYKGALGNAVLSRYPIKKVQVFPLKYVPFDWYEGEKEPLSLMEKMRQTGSKLVFQTEFTREVRAGSQIYFRVDLDVPELPEGTLTIINIHLEINCTPKDRETQTAEILSYMKKIKHPVVMMGDFNCAPQDLSPTSTLRVAERTLGDIADIFSNPVKPLFAMIQNYRFADGGAFDFRGDPERSVNGKDGVLANSNERGIIGFKTTFRVTRPIAMVIGKLRLDWVFVKSYLKDPFEKGPYRFAPYFGETLEELNTNFKTPISDHHPNVVDLPLQEPRMNSEKSALKS